ncbi:hypothetical protein AAG570_006850 [Ranatra chinensis]|uniref:C2H2-type domain-containing protein n=1 Tax=Ranatra chinensis TaxID=642074 RepID=A0ABD0ZC68_9HEMI
MCDQTEVAYLPNDVVWVKLGNVWWPGQVQDQETLDKDITAGLRKKPLAVVKFFDDAYEYVRNLDQIYHYNCLKKTDFIRKGLDLSRSKDASSNMKKFPTDVSKAETLTGGDPNIIHDPKFLPEKKFDYSEIFNLKKPKGSASKRSYRSSTGRSSGSTSLVSPSPSPSSSYTSTPPITNRKLIQKALTGKSDYESRIRVQERPEQDETKQSDQTNYTCQSCGYVTSRINVFILHNKSHIGGYASSPNTSGASSRASPYSNVGTPRGTSTPRTLSLSKGKSEKSKILKRKSLGDDSGTTPKRKQSSTTLSQSNTPVGNTKTPKKRGTKTKEERAALIKKKNEAIRETLLKDWDEEDAGEEQEEIERLKQQRSTDSPKDILDSSQETEEEKKDKPNVSKSRDTSNVSTTSKSCFDFEDNEDAIKLNETLKFGQKLPRVISDEKPKKSDQLAALKQSLNNTFEKKQSITTGENKETKINEKKGKYSQNLKRTRQSVEAVKGKLKQNNELTVAQTPKNENIETKEVLDTDIENILKETIVPTLPNLPDSNNTFNSNKSVAEKSIISEQEDMDTQTTAAKSELIVGDSNQISGTNGTEIKDEKLMIKLPEGNSKIEGSLKMSDSKNTITQSGSISLSEEKCDPHAANDVKKNILSTEVTSGKNAADSNASSKRFDNNCDETDTKLQGHNDIKTLTLSNVDHLDQCNVNYPTESESTLVKTEAIAVQVRQSPETSLIAERKDESETVMEIDEPIKEETLAIVEKSTQEMETLEGDQKNTLEEQSSDKPGFSTQNNSHHNEQLLKGDKPLNDVPMPDCPLIKDFQDKSKHIEDPKVVKHEQNSTPDEEASEHDKKWIARDSLAGHNKTVVTDEQMVKNNELSDKNVESFPDHDEEQSSSIEKPTAHGELVHGQEPSICGEDLCAEGQIFKDGQLSNDKEVSQDEQSSQIEQTHAQDRQASIPDECLSSKEGGTVGQNESISDQDLQKSENDYQKSGKSVPNEPVTASEETSSQKVEKLDHIKIPDQCEKLCNEENREKLVIEGNNSFHDDKKTGNGKEKPLPTLLSIDEHEKCQDPVKKIPSKSGETNSVEEPPLSQGPSQSQHTLQTLDNKSCPNQNFTDSIPANKTSLNDVQCMDLDINSMPIVIGEDIISETDVKQNVSIPEVSQKQTPQTITKLRIHLRPPGESKVQNNQQQIITIPGKSKISPAKSQIKLTPQKKGSDLVMFSKAKGNSSIIQQKGPGGTSQVVILKSQPTVVTSTGAKSKFTIGKNSVQVLGSPAPQVDSSSCQVTPQVITSQLAGMPGKVLILQSPSGAQNKIVTMTSQQHKSLPSKLTPGARVVGKNQIATISNAGKTSQKVIINKSGVLPTKNVIFTKSHSVQVGKTQSASQSVLNTKSVQSIVVSKSQPSSKSVIPTTVSKANLTGTTSKLQMFASKPKPKLVLQQKSKLIQAPQIKVVSKPGGIQGGTVFIQTSGQPLFSSPLQQTPEKQMNTAVRQSSQVSAPINQPQQTVAKAMPKVQPPAFKARQASPNILQRSQRKQPAGKQPSNTTPKQSPQYITIPSTTAIQPNDIILAGNSVPVLATQIAQQPTNESPVKVVYMTVDEHGNCHQLDNESLISFDANSDASALYIEAPPTPDAENIFLSIDESGNVVNISGGGCSVSNPVVTATATTSSQDILAKALADTQVLQSETGVETITGPQLFVEQQYTPAPSLSHNVLETSLTLNQPIMTPLEVPSSAGISQITASFLPQKDKVELQPSMPLLNDELEFQNQTVFLNPTDLPAVSESQLTFQLTLDNNNMVVTSTSGSNVQDLVHLTNVKRCADTSSTNLGPQPSQIPDKEKCENESFEKDKTLLENEKNVNAPQNPVQLEPIETRIVDSSHTEFLNEDSSSDCMKQTDNVGSQYISAKLDGAEGKNKKIIEQAQFLNDVSDTKMLVTTTENNMDGNIPKSEHINSNKKNLQTEMNMPEEEIGNKMLAGNEERVQEVETYTENSKFSDTIVEGYYENDESQMEDIDSYTIVETESCIDDAYDGSPLIDSDEKNIESVAECIVPSNNKSNRTSHSKEFSLSTPMVESFSEREEPEEQIEVDVITSRDGTTYSEVTSSEEFIVAADSSTCSERLIQKGDNKVSTKEGEEDCDSQLSSLPHVSLTGSLKRHLSSEDLSGESVTFVKKRIKSEDEDER